MSILNIITGLLGYQDACATDNPQLREIDWNRKMNGIAIGKPIFDSRSIPPGGSYTVFDGTDATLLDGTSVLSLALSSTVTNRYRLSVTAGAAGFRTPRSITGLSSAVVTINNNAVASFTFPGATLSGVVVGDTMRIAGLLFGDPAPYAFNPENAGYWVILSVSGSTVQVTRLAGQPFSGVAESPAVVTSSDVQIFSAAGVQIGDSVDITGTFSPVTQRVYQVIDVTPTTVDFISGVPLPLESGLAYVAGSITFYVNSCTFVYLEVDQMAAVQFNLDTSFNNLVCPVLTGDPSLIGYLNKHGKVYRMTIVNRSINPMHVRYFMAE